MEGGNKNGKIQIFAKNITGRAKGEILEEANKITNYAGGKHIQNGATGGVNNGSNQPRKPTEETEVKTIECIDELDEGSANDGSGVNTKGGILFGKTYTFKVKTYTKGIPKNLTNIKWLLSYKDPETGIYHENILSKDIRGETVRISFTENINICGCEVEVKAYISNIIEGGNLKVWHHNRFRWFDAKIINYEIIKRTTDKKPWIINQSGTSLCGMACIFYLFAKYQPEGYKVFAKRLFRTGEATYNEYTVMPSEELLNKKISKDGHPEGTDGIPLIDYVTLASTRNTDSPSYRGGDQELYAVNWPPLMTGLSQKLLGYKDVSSNGIYNPIKKSRKYDKKKAWQMILDINAQIAQGYKLMLMIDSDLISEDEDKLSNLFQLEYHWVVLETSIIDTQNWNSEGQIFYTLDFKVYTWGGNKKYLKEKITIDHFIHNYYGYIKVK